MLSIYYIKIFILIIYNIIFLHKSTKFYYWQPRRPQNRKSFFQQVSLEITLIQEIFLTAKPSAFNRQSEILYSMDIDTDRSSTVYYCNGSVIFLSLLKTTMGLLMSPCDHSINLSMYPYSRLHLSIPANGIDCRYVL